ncbi:MAG TPA: nucleotidyltransferase family protein [Gammaproteobacteria bacterium]|nr:nucleotidyltransferase family protein [Gammaproteobacteria bacterium]
MLLAAGRGERMGALTHSQPKPLLEVGGERLIERQLRLLAAAGINEIVINLSYRGAAIRDLLGGRTPWNQRITYSEEGEPPLETGGGVIAALPLLGTEPFLLLNSDIYTDFDLGALIRMRRANTLVLVPNPAHHPSGDFGLSAAGLVTREPPLSTFSGISVLCPSLFARFPPGRQPLRPVLDAAIDRGELQGVLFEGYWEDVGTPERLAAARDHGRLTRQHPSRS